MKSTHALLTAALLSGAAAVSAQSRVLLQDVSALTLRQGEYTTHRRVAPVQQLSCTRGCDSSNTPDELQCVNVGFDGVDVNWKCEADLPVGAKLTHVNIQCEGYDHPDDPYVLAGSCGASYELMQSRHAYADENRYGAHRDRPRSVEYDDGGGQSWAGLLMMGAVGFIFYNVFCGGTGGGGTHNSSYSSTTPTAPRAHPASWGSGWGFSPFGGGGGFWSGLGLGGMMGSMWSRPRRPAWGGWGGGWGGSRPHLGYYGHGNRGWGSGGGYFGGGGHSSGGVPSTGSGERRTSTSYATTTRR